VVIVVLALIIAVALAEALQVVVAGIAVLVPTIAEEVEIVDLAPIIARLALLKRRQPSRLRR